MTIFNSIFIDDNLVSFLNYLFIVVYPDSANPPTASPSVLSTIAPTVAPTSDAAYQAGWSDGYDAGYKEGYSYGLLVARVFASDPTPQPTKDTPPYIGNKNSHVLHKSSCSYVGQMKSSNKVSFDNRQDAIDQGYRPCTRCKP